MGDNEDESENQPEEEIEVVEEGEEIDPLADALA